MIFGVSGRVGESFHFPWSRANSLEIPLKGFLRKISPKRYSSPATKVGGAPPTLVRAPPTLVATKVRGQQGLAAGPPRQRQNLSGRAKRAGKMELQLVSFQNFLEGPLLMAVGRGGVGVTYFRFL